MKHERRRGLWNIHTNGTYILFQTARRIIATSTPMTWTYSRSSWSILDIVIVRGRSVRNWKKEKKMQEKAKKKNRGWEKEKRRNRNQNGKSNDFCNAVTRDEATNRDVIAIFHSERGARYGMRENARHRGRSIKHSFAECSSGCRRGFRVSWKRENEAWKIEFARRRVTKKIKRKKGRGRERWRESGQINDSITIEHNLSAAILAQYGPKKTVSNDIEWRPYVAFYRKSVFVLCLTIDFLRCIELRSNMLQRNLFECKYVQSEYVHVSWMFLRTEISTPTIGDTWKEFAERENTTLACQTFCCEDKSYAKERF